MFPFIALSPGARFFLPRARTLDSHCGMQNYGLTWFLPIRFKPEWTTHKSLLEVAREMSRNAANCTVALGMYDGVRVPGSNLHRASCKPDHERAERRDRSTVVFGCR